MTDQKTLNSSNAGPAIQPGTQLELITFRKMCEALGQPEYKVRYQLGALKIKYNYKIGAARIFSQESFDKVKAAFDRTTDKKDKVAI